MHDLVYKTTKQVLVELNVPFEIITILRLLSGLVAGYILYRLVEAPSLRWAQRQPAPLRRVGAQAAEDVDRVV